MARIRIIYSIKTAGGESHLLITIISVVIFADFGILGSLALGGRHLDPSLRFAVLGGFSCCRRLDGWQLGFLLLQSINCQGPEARIGPRHARDHQRLWAAMVEGLRYTTSPKQKMILAH